jgi:DNA-binding beta-propeller fold protein YncE
VAVSPSGGTVFVTGQIANSYGTIAYNATSGARLWAKRYPDGSAVALAVSPTGSAVYVTGVHSSAGTGGYGTVAYNAATGAQLWAQDYTGGNGEASSVAVSPSGGTVFVTGFSAGVSTIDDYATVAYNAATGAQLWVARYNGPVSGEDGATSVAVSPTGDTVYVTGSIETTSGHDYATLAYNATTGHRLWLARYNAPVLAEFGGATSVAVSPAGDTVYVTGYAGTTSGYGYATLAYNATTGHRLWLARYNGPGRDDQAYAVAVSPSGDIVFVTGFSAGASSGLDYATVAYNATTGHRLWVARYRGSDNQAASMAVSPTGDTVYVTGVSGGVTSVDDYATVAYAAATGAQQWVARYRGPHSIDNEAASVTVSPTRGTVFVTGYSTGKPRENHYATVAYDG